MTCVPLETPVMAEKTFPHTQVSTRTALGEIGKSKVAGKLLEESSCSQLLAHHSRNVEPMSAKIGAAYDPIKARALECLGAAERTLEHMQKLSQTRQVGPELRSFGVVPHLFEYIGRFLSQVGHHTH